LQCHKHHNSYPGKVFSITEFLVRKFNNKENKKENKSTKKQTKKTEKTEKKEKSRTG